MAAAFGWGFLGASSLILGGGAALAPSTRFLRIG